MDIIDDDWFFRLYFLLLDLLDFIVFWYFENFEHGSEGSNIDIVNFSLAEVQILLFKLWIFIDVFFLFDFYLFFEIIVLLHDLRGQFDFVRQSFNVGNLIFFGVILKFVLGALFILRLYDGVF